MEQLQEHFGEAIFRNAGSWQRWEPGVGEAATWQVRQFGQLTVVLPTWFHLASLNSAWMRVIAGPKSSSR